MRRPFFQSKSPTNYDAHLAENILKHTLENNVDISALNFKTFIFFIGYFVIE